MTSISLFDIGINEPTTTYRVNIRPEFKSKIPTIVESAIKAALKKMSLYPTDAEVKAITERSLDMLDNMTKTMCQHRRPYFLDDLKVVITKFITNDDGTISLISGIHKEVPIHPDELETTINQYLEEDLYTAAYYVTLGFERL